MRCFGNYDRNGSLPFSGRKVAKVLIYIDCMNEYVVPIKQLLEMKKTNVNGRKYF